MADTKSERLVGALDAFLATSPDVEAAAVVTFDGLTMASALPEGMDDDRVGAMSAALLSLGEQAARGLGRGELHQLFVEADAGFVFLMSAQDQAVLVAVTGCEAKIGFILYEMRRAAWDVGDVLDDREAPPGDDDADEPAAGALREVNGAAEEPGAADAPTTGAEDDWREPAAAFPTPAWTDAAGVRDPFGDHDLDEPSYVATNGRNGAPDDQH